MKCLKIRPQKWKSTGNHVIISVKCLEDNKLFYDQPSTKPLVLTFRIFPVYLAVLQWTDWPITAAAAPAPDLPAVGQTVCGPVPTDPTLWPHQGSVHWGSGGVDFLWVITHLSVNFCYSPSLNVIRHCICCRKHFVLIFLFILLEEYF